MSKSRGNFSASENLSIIIEADQFGVTQTLRKHQLSPSVFRRWKENFNEGGVSNLQSYSQQRNPELVAAMFGFGIGLNDKQTSCKLARSSTLQFSNCHILKHRVIVASFEERIATLDKPFAAENGFLIFNQTARSLERDTQQQNILPLMNFQTCHQSDLQRLLKYYGILQRLTVNQAN